MYRDSAFVFYEDSWPGMGQAVEGSSVASTRRYFKTSFKIVCKKIYEYIENGFLYKNNVYNNFIIVWYNY